jgi:hypothetical protein
MVKENWSIDILSNTSDIFETPTLPMSLTNKYLFAFGRAQ